MATVIYATQRQDPIPLSLRSLLPPRLLEEIRRCGVYRLEEIRLRRDRYVTLTADGRTVRLRTLLGGQELDELLGAFCNHSLYAHSTGLHQGFLSLPDGIRVGVCGRASTEEGRVMGVYDISAMNVRIPHAVCVDCAPICQLLSHGGVLIYALPGVGKTTLLRSVIAALAGGESPWRVAVIDTRCELAYSLEDPSLTVDVLSGYPRGLGIEIAARTMNAQLTVCDEIGEEKEAQAILAAQNCGVPLLASAHASSCTELLRRPPLQLLHRAAVFAHYVGLQREGYRNTFRYRIQGWEEANAELACDGSGSVGN